VRASEKAYSQLRGEILTWKLLPGTPLSEIELAERLGVSRTPLRAALARLALEGLVDTSRGRTGLVSDVSAETITELFELREALETQAARLVARRGASADFARLADRFGDAPRLLADDGIDAYYDLVAEFDRALDEALGNAVFRGALDGVRLHLARARRMATDNPERLVRSAEEHRLICSAIRDGDAALAASATTVHLQASLTTILATLDERSSDLKGSA
jgi:DNA-binding GntR family transcriptional regulator